MEMKVRLLDGTEEKSVAEVEQELLQKHEQQFSNVKLPGQEIPVVEIPVVEVPVIETLEELSEEKVLSYIEKRYNKQINSFDELMAERKETEELPEDVAAFMKYKKETGRGFDDFVNLKKEIQANTRIDCIEPKLIL